MAPAGSSHEPSPPTGSEGAAAKQKWPGLSLGGGGGGGSGAADEKLLPTTRKGLVALHLRLKQSLAREKRQRSMYEQCVHEALKHQALFEPLPTGGETGGTTSRGGASTLSSSRCGASSSYPPSSGAAIAEERPPPPERRSRWQWEVKPWLYRIGAVACGLLSVLMVWCEGTILFDDPPFNLNLSPLSYFYRWIGRGGGGFFAILCLYIPLLYTAVCTYFAMFQMRLCEGYSLHPNKHSDGSSLLFNATYACRLGPPLCFNFLKLLHEKERGGLYVHRAHCVGASCETSTYFTQSAFGNMDQIPLFSGDYFNNYAPLLIVVLAGCTLLNLGSGLVSCCAKCCPCLATPAFSFDEDFSDTRIDHGAQILLHEKRSLSEGVPLGANLQLLSGATSDSEERGAARVAPARSRFNRLNDEHL